MNSKREEHGFVSGPDGKLYAVGGYKGKGCLSSCERYDPNKDIWEDIAPLKTARRSLSAVALPDGVYVLGGYNGENYLSSVEKFDLVKGEWVEISPMNKAKCTMAAVTTYDCRFIFAIGGYDSTALAHVERYDIMRGCWELVCPMKHKRFMHAAVINSMTSQENLT